jgi:hypothetical protein
MSAVMRWWARVGAACTGIGLALVVPALAWASEVPGGLAVADELARPRPRARTGFFGGLGLVCCLVAVVIIVLLIVMLMRRRQPPRR